MLLLLPHVVYRTKGRNTSSKKDKLTEENIFFSFFLYFSIYILNIVVLLLYIKYEILFLLLLLFMFSLWCFCSSLYRPILYVQHFPIKGNAKEKENKSRKGTHRTRGEWEGRAMRILYFSTSLFYISQIILNFVKEQLKSPPVLSIFNLRGWYCFNMGESLNRRRHSHRQQRHRLLEYRRH